MKEQKIRQVLFQELNRLQKVLHSLKNRLITCHDPDLSGQSSTLTDEQKAAVAAQIKDYLANDETGKAALAQSTTEFITNVEGLMAQNGVTMDAQTTAVLEAVIKGGI